MVSRKGYAHQICCFPFCCRKPNGSCQDVLQSITKVSLILNGSLCVIQQPGHDDFSIMSRVTLLVFQIFFLVVIVIFLL